MKSDILRIRFLSILLACTVCAMDQMSKLAVMESAQSGAIPCDVAQWFRLVLAWNTGISFSMLRSVSPHMPLVLTLLTSAVVLGLMVWFFRTQDKFTFPALGLIIGGAVGNIIDRLRFGAVEDFLDVHYGAYHWPAFNVADSAICIGVVLLVLLSIVGGASVPAKGDV